jgi:hypothetical protein
MDVSGQLHAPAALPSGKLWYPLDRRLGDPQSHARLCGEEISVGFVVDKVDLGQIFSEYFGFPCQFSFHRLLHTYHHL